MVRDASVFPVKSEDKVTSSEHHNTGKTPGAEMRPQREMKIFL